MPIFRPQRQFGQWLLRALGAQDLRTGRTIGQLDWESTIVPTVNVGEGTNLPGQVSVPKREVWSFGAQVLAGGIGTFARMLVYSMASTFSTRDPRTASGCFVLDFRLSHQVGVGEPFAIFMGVPPGAQAPPAPTVTGELTALWGVETAVAVVTADIPNHRSPRVQCLAGNVAVGQPGLAAYPYVGNRGLEYTGPPIYVPPGQFFEIQMNPVEDNIPVNMQIAYCEAEEAPVEIPLK